MLNRTIVSHRSKRSLAGENQQTQLIFIFSYPDRKCFFKVNKLLLVCFKKKEGAWLVDMAGMKTKINVIFSTAFSSSKSSTKDTNEPKGRQFQRLIN